MQSIFSRAAQAHICNCRPCVQTASAMIRRSATAVTRRKASATDIFTACYTTILGTAAVADAHYKERRREDLDRRLEEARTGLARLAEDSNRPDDLETRRLMRAAEIAVPEYSLELEEAITTICERGDRLLSFQKKQAQRRAAWQDIHKIFSKIEYVVKSMGAMRGMEYDTVEGALKEEEVLPDCQHREPLTGTQFAESTKMVNQLVDALVMEVYRQAYPDDPAAMKRALESLDSVWTAIRLLRSDGYPRYEHPGIEPESTQKARVALNRVNRAIFSAWDPDRAKFLTGKICYNILVSSAPPSIHTYNTLILGFTRAGAHTLAQIVVDSLLEQSDFRPTPQTMVCMLHHYQANNDIVGFYGIIRKLMGVDAHGLFSETKSVRKFLHNPESRAHARSPNVVRQPDQPDRPSAIEVVERNQSVYEALIKGLLYFERVKDAAKVFVACIKENYMIGRDTLLQLIHYCLWTLDRPAVRILVRGLVDNPRPLISILESPDCPKKLAREIQILFLLARRISYDSAEREVLRDVTLEQNYSSLSTFIFASETERFLGLLAATLRRAQLTLANTCLLPTAAAMKILRDLRGVEGSYQYAHKEAEKYGDMMLYYHVESLSKQTKHYELRFLNLLYDSFPRVAPRYSTMKQIHLRWLKDGLPRQTSSAYLLLRYRTEKALLSSMKLTYGAKYTMLQFLSMEERQRLYDIYQDVLFIPPNLIVEAKRRDERWSVTENSEAIATSRSDLTQSTVKSASTQHRAPSFLGWQVNYT